MYLIMTGSPLDDGPFDDGPHKIEQFWKHHEEKMNNKDKPIYPVLRPVRDYFEPTKEEQVQHIKESMKGFLGNYE